MYGDFDVDNLDTSGWILFVMGSCLMTLVMLNMLIAIMSDTYARVMSEIVPFDYFELNNLILEQEEILVWKRNSGTSQYLAFAQYVEKTEKKEWEGVLGGGQNSQGGLNEEFKKEIMESIGILLENQTLQIRDTFMKFDEQKKRFDNLSRIVEKSVVDKWRQGK